MAKAYIGAGSNLGDRIGNCADAAREVSSFSDIIRVSSLYETEPVGVEEQPDFVNFVMEIDTTMPPGELLKRLKETERKSGRTKTLKWGPRIIDLDIIFYGECVCSSEGLVIPHPEAHLRRFVLEPLNEIAPDVIHPVLNRSVSELLNALENGPEVRYLAPGALVFPH